MIHEKLTLGSLLQKTKHLVLWIIAVLVISAVAHALIDGAIVLWFIPSELNEIVGWTVLIFMFLALIIQLLDAFDARALNRPLATKFK